jgi:hypothetical protein
MAGDDIVFPFDIAADAPTIRSAVFRTARPG